MSAAAASRDVALFHAMDTLHKHNYDVAKAIASLVPPGGPVLCRDEMEEWAASEANLFEEALDKYGKDFNDIRQDFLPWKSLKSIVEYYYMWKTTDRYVQQKRIKAAEAETKLKQVYIPNYNKPNPAQITNKMDGLDDGRACESCYTGHSSQWYAWGPAHMNCRLCASCWTYWKKYGGLKMPSRQRRLDGAGGLEDGDRPVPIQRQERLAQIAAMRLHRCTIAGCGKEFKLKVHLARHLADAHGLAIRAGSPRPVMKTRAAFCLITTPLTRMSRQLCSDILKVRSAARQPFQPINIASIKQESQFRLNSKKIKELKPRDRGNLNTVSARLGIDTKVETPPLLQKTGAEMKEATKLFFPKPAVTPQPLVVQRDSVSQGHPSIMRKRGYEQGQGGSDGPIPKRSIIDIARAGVIRETVISRLNGRGGKIGPRKQPLSRIDAPDDLYFIATEATRKLRKQMTQQELRRAAHKPWIRLNVKTRSGATTDAVVDPKPIVIE